jgi:carotenoid cleavage dioxygenase-like enzyme
MMENTSYTTMLQTIILAALNTRQKAAATTTRKTKKELKNVSNTNMAVKSKQQVIAYLKAGDYITLDKPVDLHIVAHKVGIVPSAHVFHC